MEQDIKDILETAVHAPSGHNYQPWQFFVRDNIIHIFNIPERDTTLFNFQQHGSLIAHGALIENIVIAAKAHGYTAHVSLFPDQQEPRHIASVALQVTILADKDILYDYIRARATNRKPYKKTPLESQHRERLLATLSGNNAGEIRFIEERSEIESLAGIFTLNEVLLFQNFHMHQSLFPHILWNAKEDAEKKLGLYLKTFELPPPAQSMFRLFRHWPIANLLARIGFPKVIAQQNKKLYAASSAIGAILLQDEKPRNFIEGGRVLQRMWLQAAKDGLSVQPVTGLLYLARRAATETDLHFTEAERILLLDAHEQIRKIFEVKDETMMMTFRIGYGEKPSAHAQKLAPEIHFDHM